MRKLIAVLGAFCWAGLLFGQDIQSSNYLPAGMLFNPSLTATSGDDIQVGMLYRNQWAAIRRQPYTTTAAMAEVRVGKMGLGMQVYGKNAGEASLKTTGAMLTGAYHKPLTEMSELSLGASIGRVQKRFNPALFTFENQYVAGEGFDGALPSGESFAKSKTAFTDLAIGLNWKGLLSNSGRVKGHAGLSLAHVHLPDEGLNEVGNALPMKISLIGGAGFQVGDQLDLSPNVFYQKQGQHQDLILGIDVGGNMSEKTKVEFGMAYRIKDAFIGRMGLIMGNKKFYFSYDANNSPLKTATNGNGAWELGIYLAFNHKKKEKKIKSKPDSDGDGVYDAKDKCPSVPGLPELNGCPSLQQPIAAAPTSPDSDGDGVPDNIDRCPLVPGLMYFYGCNDKDRDGTFDEEDSCPEIFGPPENDGCPVNGRDSDRDGVPDDEDYCVFLKGLKEFHGCPDSDDDGVSDVEDQCPYIKGTKANNGCPSAAVAASKVIVTHIVEFDSDRHDLKPEYQQLLDEFIRHAPLDGGYRVVVSGHTDAEGTALYNYELGERRANQVKLYLAERGIPYGAIETISYGESISHRSNDTFFGKARNRRCEVRMILE